MGKGWIVEKAKDARAARAGDADPKLRRRHNLQKPVSTNQSVNNAIFKSFQDAKALVKAYKKREHFPEGSYKRLCAAVQVAEEIEQHKEAKRWSLSGAGRPLKYFKYLEWRLLLTPSKITKKEERKNAKKEARKSATVEKNMRREKIEEEHFRTEDLTAEIWLEYWATGYRIQTGRDASELQ